MESDTVRRELLHLMPNAVVRAAPGAEFTLASGAKSTYYFDAKRVTQAPEAVPLIGELVWNHARDLSAEAVGGLAQGCIPMADAAIAYDAFEGRRGLRSFFVRDEKKEHGTGERVYQAFSPDGRQLVSPGRRVLVVDDVLTTGSSILRAIEEVEERGAIVVGVLVLIDRLDARSMGLKRRYQVKALYHSDRDGLLSIPQELALA